MDKNTHKPEENAPSLRLYDSEPDKEVPDTEELELEEQRRRREKQAEAEKYWAGRNLGGRLSARDAA